MQLPLTINEGAREGDDASGDDNGPITFAPVAYGHSRDATGACRETCEDGYEEIFQKWRHGCLVHNCRTISTFESAHTVDAKTKVIIARMIHLPMVSARLLN